MKKITKLITAAVAGVLAFGLASCANTLDSDTLLKDNGTSVQNALKGINLKGLPSVLNGQKITVAINNKSVAELEVKDGEVSSLIKDAYFNAAETENKVTIYGTGTDYNVYKLGAYVDEAFAQGYKYTFDKGEFNKVPEYYLSAKVDFKKEPSALPGNDDETGLYAHWWGNDNSTNWATKPKMTAEDTQTPNVYKFTLDMKTTQKPGGIVLVFTDSDDVEHKVSGGNIEGDAIKAIDGAGYYVYNNGTAAFEKDKEKSEGKTTIWLEYTPDPTVEVAAPAKFLKSQTLIYRNSFDNSELKITGIFDFDGKVDGSNWSWNSGDALELTSTTDTYVAEANAETPSWAIKEAPFVKSGYPEGFDTPIKIKVTEGEFWIPYKKGGKAEFNWFDKVKAE